MNSPKFLPKLIGVMLAIVFLAGCGAPAATPTLPPTFPPPPPAPATFPPPSPPSPTISTGGNLFKLVNEVQVAPIGNQINASFARIGYVPGRDAIVVTFDTMLTRPEGNCTTKGYAWREYTMDMTATGNQGLINCYGGAMDTGGLFEGNDFYFAYQAPNPTTPGSQGWVLTKYNAVTWATSESYFFQLAQTEDPGDPMFAVVNGLIDISSKVENVNHSDPNCSFGNCWTHHQFFTMDLQFVEERVLKDTMHNNLTSMLQTTDGVIHFVAGAALIGDVYAIRYDRNWNYLGEKTILTNSAAPEGIAFDGSRFYVSYVYMNQLPQGGRFDNVRLAAFDSDWNLLDDVAVTNYSASDLKNTARPSLTLHNGRIYVCWDENENTSDPANSNPEMAVSQVHVKVYELARQP